MKKLIILLIAMLAIAACQVTNNPAKQENACNPPMIEVGGECCLNKNNNSICDELETKKETTKLTGAVISEPKPKPEIKYMNLTQIEHGINLTYYPIKKFSFTNPYRRNLTEVEKTFDIRDSDRFVIYKMKYEHDYLNTEKNFSNFITALYDLEYKNSNIWARDTIDLRKRTDSNWIAATYYYEPYLEKITIGGKPAFYETQVLIFNENGQVLNEINFDMRIILWCTPELVVRMYPSDRYRFYYQFGNSVDGILRTIKKTSPAERKIMEEEALKILKVCEGQIEPYKMKPNEILLDEYGDFTPNKMEMPKGGKIILDNQMKWTEGVILIFLDESNGYSFTSDYIPRDTSMEIQVNRSGNYRLFAEVLDGKVNLTVT